MNEKFGNLELNGSWNILILLLISS